MTASRAARPKVLVFTPTLRPFIDLFNDTFELVFATDATARREFIAGDGPSVSAIITTGKFGLTREEIAGLAGLKMVCVLGAGTENIDIRTLDEAGIPIEIRSGTNSETVADHAFALTLALLRDIPFMDAGIRRGEWTDVRSSRPMAGGKRLGIAGFGAIGRAVAHRGAGFDMKVGYFGRKPKPGVSYTFYADCSELAAASDILVVCLPGGVETVKLVNAEVLRKLGPRGYLINVGRGSVVDEDALIRALEEGSIAGAGLDVFDDEPKVHERLKNNRRTVLTPHVGGRSPESDAAMVDAVLQGLKRHFGPAG